MAKRRVILVMIEPPLPFGNAAGRWLYVLLKGLVERGHEVVAFAACAKPEEIAKSRALFPAPDYDLRLYPFPVREGLGAKLETALRPHSFMFGPEFRRDLDAELAKGCDILHLEQLWSGWLALDHPDRALVSVHYLLGIDLGEFRPKTWRGRLEQGLAFRAERKLIRRLKHFRACSDRIAAPIAEAHPGAEVDVVPFGLDSTLYGFIPEARRGDEQVLSLIGSMNWYPGLSAAIRLLTRLWPEIKRKVPGAKLQIVGWAARSALRDYLDLPDVTIAEDVPEIQPYFDRTSVLLYAPVRGSGMKMKVLESMAFGVPVVTTTEGVEGIPALDGVHAGVADDDAGLIERTVALLLDPARQERQRVEARRLLESHCGPEATVSAIERIYDRMLARPEVSRT